MPQPSKPSGKSDDSPVEGRVTTALMLAAGQGTRLRPVTDNIPKCLVDVDGKTLLQRIFEALEQNGFKRLVMVTGYRNELVEDFLNRCGSRLEIQPIHNPQYEATNNIHSMWLAEEAIDEPFLLLESDLVFDPKALKEMTLPDRIALDRFNPGVHNGTTARITPCGYLHSLHPGGDAPDGTNLYKTVNIYSFSRETRNKLFPVLYSYVAAGRTDVFYERALHDLVASGNLQLKVADFTGHWWDEIDSGDDLLRVRRQLKEAAAT